MQARIGIHDGTFHCDEVLACVLLKMMPEYQDAEIVRTRDPKILDKCDIVVDVGGVFDHEARRYDHHQAEFNITMGQISKGMIKSDVKLSSAGLIYWHYGMEILTIRLNSGSKAVMQYAFHHIYGAFVKEIYDIDNNGGRGQSMTNITARVGHLRPLWDDPDQDMGKGFDMALDMVRQEFLCYIPRIQSIFRARDELNKNISERFQHHPSGYVI